MDVSVKQRINNSEKSGLVALLVLVLAALAAPVQAQSANERNELKELRGLTSGSTSRFAPQPGVSIERATQIARKHTGGRVISATPRERSSGTEYRVRMLVDGERVVTVTVDARGRIKKKR